VPAKAGQIVIDITAGTKQFVVDMESASAKIRQFGQEAHGSVSGVQAVSGTLRVLEGNVTNNLRAAERWVASLPGVAAALKVAFPVVGAVAFGGIVTELGSKVHNFFKEIQDAPGKISNAFRSLNDPLRATNDALEVSNARLENDIAKLEGKPQNNLKLALLEAVEAADKLADSLDKDLASLSKILKDNNVSVWRQLLGEAGTDDLQKEFGDGSGSFPSRIRGINDAGNDVLRAARDAKAKDAAQTLINTRLLEEYAAEISKVNGLLATSKGLQFQRDNQPRTGVRGAMADGSVVAAINTPADQTIIIKGLQGALRKLQEDRDRISLTAQNTDLTGKKGDLTDGVEDRRKASETLLRLSRELAEAKAAQLGAIERVDAEEANEVHNLAMAHQQTQANLELVEQIYDAKRLTEYNKLMQQTVKLHLNLSSALQKVTTEEAAAAVYGPQFAEAAKQLENNAKAAVEWAKEYNRITAETDSESIRHRVSMAGVNGNPNDPLGTLAAQQALERVDIEARYQEKIRGTNDDKVKSIALDTKELELMKLQDEMEERTAAARHKNLTDFMRDMQGQSKSAGDILYDAANSGLDQTSGQLAKLVTGQKTSFGKTFEGIGEDMTKQSIKSMTQKGLGALGKKLGIGPAGKPDGTKTNPFWVIMDGSGTPKNPLAGMAPSLPPALGGGSGGALGGLGGILGKAGGWLGKLFGAGGGAGIEDVTSSISFMAGGGNADPGKIYGVAEVGEAELISPKNSSRITPLSKLRGGGDTHIHVDARGAQIGAEGRIAQAVQMAHDSAVQGGVRANAEREKRTPRRK
jgi:hypothetical protein